MRWGRRCILATAAEEALLKSFAPWARTAVIPNGVDLSGYGPPADVPTVIFTGAMDYFPNVDAVQHFCAEIFPAVARAVPGARFLIVGLNPGARGTQARRDSRVSPSPAPCRTCGRTTGRRRCAWRRFASPRGIQNKVLQSMALGVPVVATGAAARGLECRPGEHFLVEDDPACFAERVIGLLRDREARTVLASRARAFVEEHHSWSAVLDRIESTLVEAAGARNARSASSRAGASPATPKAEVTRP